MNNHFPLELLPSSDLKAHFSLWGLASAAATYEELIEDQDARLAAGEPVSRIPLLWRALAETAGLTVDDDGRIIDGPHAEVCGLAAPAPAFACIIQEVP